MQARIIKIAEDEGLEAVIEINGEEFEVMDCLGYGNNSVKEGDLIDVKLTVGIGDDNEDMDMIFKNNPEKLKKTQPIRGWSYRAFGEVISIKPGIVDCGNIIIKDFIDLDDYKCIGKYIAFNILRLDAYVKDEQT